jgi:hypothetical protein
MKNDGIQVNSSKIVVSNTFTQEWEMQPYYELAEKYGKRKRSLETASAINFVDLAN